MENHFAVARPVDPAAVYDPVRRASRDYSDFSPELGVELRPVDAVMLYATYSEGFKSGTANLGERVPNLVKPETIENIEAGLKSWLLKDSLMLNVAAFKYKVENAQYDRTYAITAPPFYAARLENAATTDGKGVELETSWIATDHFKMSFAGTYYHIRFDKFLSQNPINPALFGPGGSTSAAGGFDGQPSSQHAGLDRRVVGDVRVAVEQRRIAGVDRCGVEPRSSSTTRSSTTR